MRAGEVWLWAGDEALQPQLAWQPGLQRAATVWPWSLHLTWGHRQGRGTRYCHVYHLCYHDYYMSVVFLPGQLRLFVSETCFDTCFCLLLLLMSFALSQSQQLMLVEVQSWFFSLEAVVEKMSPPQGPFSSYPRATRQLPMDLVVRLFSQLFPSSRINFEPWLLS